MQIHRFPTIQSGMLGLGWILDCRIFVSAKPVKTVKMLILDRLARVIATTLKSVVCAVFVEMRVIWLWQPDNNFIGTFRYFVTSH